MNDGVKVVALVSVDPAGPERTVQEYVSGSPSGSEAVPERIYGVPIVTLLSAPAFAVGARLVVKARIRRTAQRAVVRRRQPQRVRAGRGQP